MIQNFALKTLEIILKNKIATNGRPSQVGNIVIK
jgi:hypothetical protein